MQNVFLVVCIYIALLGLGLVIKCCYLPFTASLALSLSFFPKPRAYAFSSYFCKFYVGFSSHEKKIERSRSKDKE